MPNTAVVIGTGLAGATTAFALQQAGLKVLVLERNNRSTMGASSNPICIMYPRFDAQWNKYTQFYLAAYLHGLQFYQNYPNHFIPSGVLAFAKPGQPHRFTTIAKILGPEICQLHDIKDFPETEKGPALLLHNSGYLYTKGMCELLLQNVKVQHQQEVASLKQTTGGQWQILNHQNEVITVSTHVVLANSRDAADIVPYLKRAVYMVRGQSSITTADIGHHSQHVLCFPCISVTPMVQGHHHFGSTYDRDNSSLALSDKSHQENINNLGRYLPQTNNIHPSELVGTAGNRCFTKDYLPIVGKVPGCKGVYLNISHGSRGVVSTPISAAILTNMITSETNNKISDILSPKRFINDAFA